MHHLCRHLQFCSEVAQGHSPFPAVLVLDLVQVCGEEWVGPENSLDWDWAVRTGIEVAVLPPEIWAASVAVFSQDLSALDAVLNWCRVHGAGALSFDWEKKYKVSCGTTRACAGNGCHHITWITPHTPQASCLCS